MAFSIKLPENVKGLEYKFATYVESHDGRSDAHIVKEYIHGKDGTRTPSIRIVENYEKKFWITKPGFRNHKDKKESEEIGKLQEFTTTQLKLNDAVSRALNGRPAGQNTFRQISSSPYLYGCEIASGALLKHDYGTLWPDCIAPKSTVAVFDVEADVVNGTEEIILATLSFKDKVVTTINKSFIDPRMDPLPQVEAIIEKYYGQLYKDRGIKVEYVFCDTPGQCCDEVFKRAHKWKPDFITIWNIDYDIPKVISTMEAEGYNLADVFSDPCVPRKYRTFKYIKGKAQKVTQDGSITPLHWADRWHVVEAPCSFYFIDAGCLYKRIRIAKGMEPSYSLDSILKKYLNTGKMKIKEVDHLSGLPWHHRMQTNFKLEYLVYNQIDCIALEQLDEKNGDIASQFCVLVGNSEFGTFTSNPRKIVDDLHFYYQGIGEIIATTGNSIKDDNDDMVIGMKQWIVTLPAYLVTETGMNFIKDMPLIKSMMNIHLADLDIEGTYPTIEVVANISKKTTVRELSRIEGVSEEVQRRVGINLSASNSNAIEICVDIFKAPTPHQWYELYMTNR